MPMEVSKHLPFFTAATGFWALFDDAALDHSIVAVVIAAIVFDLAIVVAIAIMVAIPVIVRLGGAREGENDGTDKGSSDRKLA